MITLIRAIPPNLEEGYCPANWREFALKLFQEAQFVFQSDVGNSFYNYGPGPVSVDNRTFPWLRTVGGRQDRWYTWSPDHGAWISPYWIPSEAIFAFDWPGTETALKELDNPGGAAVPVTETTGPFWEVDHNFDFRVAVGAGTLPLSSTILSVGAKGGVDRNNIILGSTNLPRHRHFITLGPEGTVDASYLADQPAEEGTFKVTTGEVLKFYQISSVQVGQTRETGGDSTGATVPIVQDNMPPYTVVLKARRTGRKYYAV